MAKAVEGTGAEEPRSTDAGADARGLVRSAFKGALATLDRETGHPYASLVTIATHVDGAPLFLISKLALHTLNLSVDARASVLVDATGADGNPLAGGRVTLLGRAAPIADPVARRRFLARHPDAAGYADFSDFSFYSLAVERAHYVGGFGRILRLAPGDVLVDTSGAGALLSAEEEIVAHMNADHADAVALYATVLLGGAPAGESAPWHLAGVDPEGCDIVRAGTALRLAFSRRIATPAALREEFVRLAAEARARAAQG